MDKTFNSLKQSLNKAYLKEKVARPDIERLKNSLRLLLSRIDVQESETNIRDHLRDFLNDTWYRDRHLITSKERADLVIHADKTAKSPAAVLFEVKRPKNAAEMVTPDHLNRKALQELVLYYLRERVEHENRSIKTLIITDIHTWFLFDENDFERHIYHNKKLVEYYQTAKESEKNTDIIYKTIGKDFLPAIVGNLNFTYFDLRDFQKTAFDDDPKNDHTLIPLYKGLSPVHLLQLPFANDSNSLNQAFYKELLHLIGLEETKDGGKKIIARKAAAQRHPGSLLENTIATLETEDVLRRLSNVKNYGATRDEQLFNVGLELVITWVNRLLFLKLLESQLLSYHAKNPVFRFLNFDRIHDFDELNELFFDVLAKQTEVRPAIAQQKFEQIPYLNSSLFEINDLESQAVRINSLKDRLTLPVLGATVLKDPAGRKKTGELRTLDYLFNFLDAYDFSSEGSEEIQEESKTLINAAVLGLIFEKINGYRDGSFFTPGFITMYMCRATIRRAVISKFNERYNWRCDDLDDLKNQLADRRTKTDLLEANEVVNSLKICDPAVGSGHFLVSALNEIIALKSELRLLADERGLRLPIEAKVENDELIVTDENGLFTYYLRNGRAPDETQRIQQTLFREKQKIIENCLFGVDINPNSVKICRLRLWIELLKNAYYKTADSARTAELETLPNIDINIKQGNSLIARFGLDADLSKALKSIKFDIKTYKGYVHDYHHATNRDVKQGLMLLIDQIKNDFRSEIGRDDPKRKRLDKLASELYHRFTGNFLFEAEEPYGGKKSGLEQKREEEKQKIEKEIQTLKTEIEEIRSNAIFQNAFEWRFEFPEVLDDEGRFVGFDVVLGNPPYGVKFVDSIKAHYQSAFVASNDIYSMFLERCSQITKKQSLFSLIIPIFWQTGDGYLQTRNFIKGKCELVTGIVLPYDVFEDAYVDTGIYIFKNESQSNYHSKVYEFSPKEKVDFDILTTINFYNLPSSTWEETDDLKISFNRNSIAFSSKMNVGTIPISEMANSVRGILADSNDILVTQPNSDWKPFFDGKLNRFVNEEPSKYVLYSDKLKEKPKEYDWFLGKRILVRRIVSRQFRIMATIVEEEFVVKKDLYIFKVHDSRFLIEFILAIINSKFISFLKTQSSNTAKKDDFTQLTLTDIRQLKIKVISIQEQEPYKSLVTRILALKKSDPSADTSALESEIDQLVYGLYDLTPEEVAVIEAMAA